MVNKGKLYRIPNLDNYYITKESIIYFKNKELKRKEILGDLYVIINNDYYLVAELMLKTFVGTIDLSIGFYDGDRLNTKMKNLYYIIKEINKIDEETICISNINFKRIYGYNNYYVSKCGIVYSLHTERFLTKSHNSSTVRYPRVSLQPNEGKSRHGNREFIHHIVFKTYVTADIPKGYEIDHIDCNPWNCDLSNLQLLTKKQNSEKRYNLYSWSFEQLHYICKCLEDDVPLIDIGKGLNMTSSKDLDRLGILIINLRKRIIWQRISSMYYIDNWNAAKNRRYGSRLFTDEQVKDIYYAANTNKRGIIVSLAKKYKTSEQTIRDIKYKRRYNYILDDL